MVLVPPMSTLLHLAMRFDDHRKDDPPVGQYLVESSKEKGGTVELKSEFIDQTGSTLKLVTLQDLHIPEGSLKDNTSDEFRSRELTLKLEIFCNKAKIHKTDMSEPKKLSIRNNRKQKNKKKSQK